MESVDEGQRKDSTGTGVDVMETCFNYCSTDRAFFSSDERRHINRVRKLKEQYPEQVQIIKEPEDNDGCIYCELPVKWLSVRPPVKRVLTDEQRKELSDRMRNTHRNVLDSSK